MPDEKLQRYLAEHYYSGPKSEAVLEKYGDGKKKKKKRRADAEGTDPRAVLIRDEGSLWFGETDEHDDAEAETEAVHVGPIVQDTAPSSKQSQKSGWTAIRKPTSEAPSAPDTPVPEATSQAATPEMETRPKAGLMSREQLRAQREAREAAERAAAKEEAMQQDEQLPEAQQTVYRDAQGRRVNIEEEEERLKQEEQERLRKKEEQKQWNRGLVQRREEAEQRAMLDSARHEQLTKYVSHYWANIRYADDKHLNSELRERVHWDDPARAFLTRRAGRRVVRPQYEGPAPPPNRFGIKPGYRWDGVDRSNGFERKMLMSINNAQRIRTEHHGTYFSMAHSLSYSLVCRGYVTST
ncbi:Pre-mRNA-splicing factor Cwc26 [Malassezia pachydermatis]